MWRCSSSSPPSAASSALASPATTGAGGNEEVLNARSLNLSVAAIRHAVVVPDWDEQKSQDALRDAARDALMNWSLEKLRADIIVSLELVTADGSVQIPFSTATAAQRNYWMVNNADRMLFSACQSPTPSPMSWPTPC